MLCINGAGIFNRWMKNMAGVNYTYEGLNKEAAKISAGADGLFALPFGNGAERMLNNQIIGGHFLNLDLNTHTTCTYGKGCAGKHCFCFSIWIRYNEREWHESLSGTGRESQYVFK